MQSGAELDQFYSRADPWDYDKTADDARRVELLLADLPNQHYGRTLDIGCGNGFLTSRLPGEEIIGTDISVKAIEWARARCTGKKYTFEGDGIFDLSPVKLGTFDLVVITGILYPQYIGQALSSVKMKIDSLLNPGGVFAHAHIMDWFGGGFPYDKISMHVYKYRNYYHLLEVYKK